MKFTALERAFTTVDLLISGGSAVMVAAACIFAYSTFSHAAYAQAYNSAGKAAAQTVVDSLERDCGGAIACFVPASDVGGHSNADGHEVAMYTRDAAGTGKFWSYCYRASGTTNCSTSARSASVNLYGAYAWTDLPQNGGAGPALAGAIASNITGLAAKTIAASQLLNTTTNPLTAAVFQTAGYTTITDVTRRTGYTNVLAGNQVTIVSISSEGLSRTIHIAAGARPTHIQTVIGQVTPAPNALIAIGSGTSLVFQNPIAAAQGTGIAENNYGTRSTTPPQNYTLTSDSCGSVSTSTPSGTLNPLSDGTGSATFTVTPIVHVAPAGETCNMVYTDNSGQTASFGITVGATYNPTAGVGAASYLSGNAVTFTATEQNYAPLGSGGGFTAATSGACNPPVLVSESMSGTTYTATYSAVSGSNGGCNFSAVDVYGQSATAGTSIIAQQLVCNTDPSAGQTIGTIQYIGTTAVPPCAAPTPPPTAPPTIPPAPPTTAPVTPSPHVAVENFCQNHNGVDQDVFGNDIPEGQTFCATFFADESWEYSAGNTALVCGAGQINADNNSALVNPQYENAYNPTKGVPPTGAWVNDSIYYPNGNFSTYGIDQGNWQVAAQAALSVYNNLSQIQDSTLDRYCPGYSDP
jgi:hypothetical protein